MKNKKYLLGGIIITFVILITAYFSYKAYLISYYSDKDLDLTFKETSNAYKINDNITINTQKIDEEEYLQFKEIKIKNEVANYKKEFKSDVTGDYVTYTDTENKNYLSLGITEPYIKYLHLEENANNNADIVTKNITYKVVQDYVKNHHITTDLELFDFLANNNYQTNILTKSKDIKGSYALYTVAQILNPNNKKIIKLNGDLTGYIFEQDENIREINLLKNNKRYVLVMMGNYFNEEKVIDLLTTIFIENN